MELMVKTGREEKQMPEQNKNYHKEVPAITVVVDGGWSKRSHKHSYNANSGVDVIFGAATKKLLYSYRCQKPKGHTDLSLTHRVAY